MLKSQNGSMDSDFDYDDASSNAEQQTRRYDRIS